MKRLFLLALMPFMVSAHHVGTAQEGYTFVQQCDGPNCMPTQSWRQPIARMPIVSEMVPVLSPPSVTYSAPQTFESIVVSPPSSVPTEMLVPTEAIQYSIVEVAEPVSQQPVPYSTIAYPTYQMQSRPLVLPRLFPRIRSNMRNRMVRNGRRW